MPSIQTYLQDILDAVYGEEVRGAIHNAIEECYTDVTTSATAADAAATAANAAASAANTAAADASAIAQNAGIMATTEDRIAESAFMAESSLAKSYTRLGVGVNADTGNDWTNHSECMCTGYRVLDRSVLFNITNPTYKYLIYLYSTNNIDGRLYCLTEKEYIQGPIVIPKTSFHKKHVNQSTMTDTKVPVTAVRYRVSVQRVDGADLTAEDQAAAEAATVITELTDKSLTIDGAIADAQAVGDRFSSMLVLAAPQYVTSSLAPPPQNYGTKYRLEVEWVPMPVGSETVPFLQLSWKHPQQMSVSNTTLVIS